MASPIMFPPGHVCPSAFPGQSFRGPDGRIMENIGEIEVMLLLENRERGSVSFQVAENIHSPHLAVSEINRQDNVCWFDGENSFVLLANSPELAKIRRLVHRI